MKCRWVGVCQGDFFIHFGKEIFQVYLIVQIAYVSMHLLCIICDWRCGVKLVHTIVEVALCTCGFKDHSTNLASHWHVVSWCMLSAGEDISHQDINELLSSKHKLL